MRIVIDMQGAQTESRFRGIGRYTLSLVKAMVCNKGDHEIILALNGLFPDTIEPIRAAFDKLLPQENICVWCAPGPVKECKPGNDNRRQVAELIREAFLANLQPDVVLITSLFEGYVDDAVTSIATFARQMPTAVILYDLIPLLNPGMYLDSNPLYKTNYLRKIDSFKRADLWLGISAAASQEGCEALGLDSGMVINISTACDSVFNKRDIAADGKKQLCDSFNIAKAFIFSCGSGEDHKNSARLIKAYAKLSKKLRQKYQLVFAGKMSPSNIVNFKTVARSAGLDGKELIFVGYVSDDEFAKLYSLCSLFVFPSLHEGFGLPALEAMACGAAVIGANTTSVPEVIGREDALFDPYDVNSIANKMTQVLEDDSFRSELSRYGMEQAKKFSWDASARKALNALEQYIKNVKPKVYQIDSKNKPKLAYFSPLPPARSGISDYSAELLPFLSEYYDITLIIDQEKVLEVYGGQQFPIYTAEWFLSHVNEFDRIVYQLGNSPFHSYMRPILKENPGVIVLHDFFMSSVLAYEQIVENRKDEWNNALFYSHGYWALKELFDEGGIETCKIKYPCNFEFLENAKGVISHSHYSKRLADSWYNDYILLPWDVIPLLRVTPGRTSKEEARKALGLSLEDFIVCSFGFLDQTKLNNRLLDAWRESTLCQKSSCKLVFVGENPNSEYGYKVLSKIKKMPISKNITLTGWASMGKYKLYLEAVDIGVQLRTQSRGETSAAVLDCMNYGLATIVNANGSMADLSDNSVYMLNDEFADTELVYALEKLYKEKDFRLNLGKEARKTIHTRHNPATCAKQYMETIETSYTKKDLPTLISAIAKVEKLGKNSSELMPIAQAVADSIISPMRQKQLLVDVSSIVRTDLKTGIERVVRAQLMELIKSPPRGFRVEPVFLSDENGWHYNYAREYTCNILGIDVPLEDEPIDFANGDILYQPDYYPSGIIEAHKFGLFNRMKAHGVIINSLIHDLLPVTHTSFFPPSADKPHNEWLSAISDFSDNIICISRAVSKDLQLWIKNNKPTLSKSMSIQIVSHGADIDASFPSKGLPKEAEKVITKLNERPSFLMVGTIEPRKGHLQTIMAFEELWQQGLDCNLVIVGKEGWTALDDSERRTIPEIVHKLSHHPELNQRLFWLDGISDEYLERVYKASTCLIASSEGEGFGLPLIEAAQHKLPIIARDIPVFREVAGEYAYYFVDERGPVVLSQAIFEWVNLYKNNEYPASDALPWLTWEESAYRLKGILLS